MTSSPVWRACLLIALATGQPLRAETLVLATSDSAPIFDARRANSGFLNLLFQEMSRRLNINLQLEKMPSERGLLSANRGILDGDANRVSGLTRLYPNLVEIPEPVMYMEFVSFERNGRPGWKSLYGKDVGIIRGWKIAEQQLKDHATLVSVREPVQLMNLLLRKRVDAVVYEKHQGMLLVNELGAQGVLNWYPLETKVMHIYLNKSNARWVKPISDVLASIRRDGSHQRIADMTISPHREDKQSEAVKNDAD